MTPLKIIIGCLFFDVLQLLFWIECMHLASNEDWKQTAKRETETR